MFIELITPLSLLLSLSLLLAFVFYMFRRESLTAKVLSGCIYGFIAVFAMMMPFNFMPGFIFDSRSVILSLSGFFGGPVVAVIASIIASLYRYSLGGAGDIAGVLVVLLCAATGTAYYYIRNHYQIKTKIWHFFVFGVFTHFVAIFGLAVLPDEIMWKVVKNLSIPFFSIYPLATVILGSILHNINLYFDRGEELVKTKHKLQAQSELLQKQVDELIAAEENARATEKRFHKSVLNAPYPIMIHAEGEVIELSKVWTNITGYTKEDIPTIKKWVESAYGKDATPSEEFIDELYNLKELQHDGEWEITIKDGSTRFWDFSSSPTARLADGRRAVISMAVDITERKQAEEALRKSEEMMRSSQSVAHICSYSTNLNINNIEQSSWVCSPEFYNIFGIDETYPHTIAGWANFIHPDHCEEVFDYHESVVKEKKSFSREYKIIRINDGTERWVHGTGELDFDEKGNPVRMHGAIQDITERKQAEEEKQLLEYQLHQSQKIESVGRLAGGVAHDYNNMLSVIIGNTELAQMKAKRSAPLDDNLEYILQAANRSKEITRQLLAFARKQIISPKVVDLNVIVKNMLKMLSSLLGEDIDLRWQPKADLWQVKIDPSQLDQVLANLCINARDAITENGKITIETVTVSLDEDYCKDHPDFNCGNYVVLSVTDNGCGMDKETLDKVFEPFFTTKKTGEGTGLGLATVYGIVKQSGGFINVYSEPNQGTTFKIYFPRHEGETAVSQETTVSKVQKGQGETVLLVEDEKAIVKLATAMLEDLGYRVLPTNSPVEALNLLKEFQGDIHLLLTDVVMPGMNGRELAKQVQDIHPKMKALYMSGYTANVIAHHGVLDEGINFIQKPFSRHDLSIRVREILDSNT